MEYQVQEYERCDVMQEGSIEDILIGVTKPSIDRLLKMQNPGDCIALYTTYCYVRKWQHNSNVWATSEYMMKALDWGRDRFSKAKNQLLESGFIEDVKVLGDGNKITRHFVKIRYAMKATMGKFHTAEIPQGGKPADKCNVIVDEIPFNGNEIITRQHEKAILSKMRKMSDSFREVVKRKSNVIHEQNSDGLLFPISQEKPEQPKREKLEAFKTRACGLMGRRTSTAWSVKELRLCEPHLDTTDEDWKYLEAYYANRGQKDFYCRKNMETLLNNWAGEIDKSREHALSKEKTDWDTWKPNE